MSEPFDDWRNSRNGIVIRQMAIAQVRKAYNLGFTDGAKRTREDVGRAIIEMGLWTQEMSERVLAVIKQMGEMPYPLEADDDAD